MTPTNLAVGLLCLCSGVAFGETLVVMTYNIHHGEGTDGKLDLERIAAIVRDQRPDVVCLQEVDRNLPRTNSIDMPRVLGELLDMYVVFGDNYAFDGGLYGNATLTRLPIVEHENRRLPNPKNAEPRGCLRVRVATNGHVVDVFNTHFGLDPEERREQAAAIVDMVGEFPVLLAGDLNAVRGSPPLSILETRFVDSFQPRVLPESTLPKARNPRRIDYVLLTHGVRSVASHIVTEGEAVVASDHYPYVAKVDLGPPPDSLEDKGVMGVEDDRLRDAVLEDHS